MIATSDATTELAAIRPPAACAPAIGAGEYAPRLDKARAPTERLGGAALLVHTRASLRYFTGVPWRARRWTGRRAG